MPRWSALRAAADEAGVHVVINGCTDFFLRKDDDDADRVERAVVRLKEAAATKNARTS
jgi:hypothetical protein